jgi:hypothetical protein
MVKVRKAVRTIALLLILKAKDIAEAAFAALLCYGIAQWSVPAALVVAGAGAIAAFELRTRGSK